MKINTNILSLNAQRNLGNTTRALSRAMARLASGQRINSAGDDAAGLAIGTGLDAQRRGMIQAVRNMNDARGFLNTAEGAMQTQTDLVQRMRELAMQASNGTLSNNDRRYLDAEAQQLLEEFNRITNQTQFNGVKLLDGNFGTKSLQVGSKKGHTIDFNLANMQARNIFTESTTVTTTTVGSGTFQARAIAASLGDNLRGLDSADLNGDGKLDLISTGVFFNKAYISLGLGDGTFQAATNYSVGASAESVEAKDVNGDGILDLITADAGDATASILLGNGNGTFKARTTVATGSSPHSVVTGDMNGDGKIDLVSTDQASDTVSILLGNGNGTFQTRTTVATGDNDIYRNAVIAVDVNGDGKLDILNADSFDNTVSIILGNGNGTFQARTTIKTVGNTPEELFAADVNGDGKLDLLTAENNGDDVSIFIGNGNGTFQAATFTSTGAASGPNSVFAIDVNGDGKLDLLTSQQYTSAVGIAFGNGNGTFQVVTTMATGNTPWRVLAADFNGDGANDIVTADYVGGTESIFLGNTTAGGTTTTTIAATISLLTQSSAEDALELLDRGLTYINSARSNIGALTSRLNFAESVGQKVIENISAARSQIMDTDMAEETANFAKLQILQQAGIAVLGQANLNSQLTLKLLQNL